MLDDDTLSNSLYMYTNDHKFCYNKLEVKLNNLYGKGQYSLLLLDSINNICHPNYYKRCTCK
jgi:hypothetical protein